jgi:hypothetical protein
MAVLGGTATSAKWLVPVECFTQHSRQEHQEHIEIISFGIWSETENPVTRGRSGDRAGQCPLSTRKGSGFLVRSYAGVGTGLF